MPVSGIDIRAHGDEGVEGDAPNGSAIRGVAQPVVPRQEAQRGTFLIADREVRSALGIRYHPQHGEEASRVPGVASRPHRRGEGSQEMVEGGPAVAPVRVGRGCASFDQRFRRCPCHPSAGHHQRSHPEIVARSVAERIGVRTSRQYRRDGIRIVHGDGLMQVHTSRDCVVVPGEERGGQLDPVLDGEVDGLPADPGLRLRIDAASD